MNPTDLEVCLEDVDEVTEKQQNEPAAGQITKFDEDEQLFKESGSHLLLDMDDDDRPVVSRYAYDSFIQPTHT